MPDELNPREVLLYLNELGYKNINAQQLKEFMIDLKKLIKYDDQCFEEELDGNYDSPKYIPDYLPGRDVFKELYHTDTIASRAKLNRPKKESIITVQVNGPRSSALSRPVSVQTSSRGFAGSSTGETLNTQRSVRLMESPSGATLSAQRSAVNERVEPLRLHPSPLQSAVTQTHTCSCCAASDQRSANTISSQGRNLQKKGKKTCKLERNKSSFIRPRLNTKPPKSDPVALYHQYQEEWKKHKIPGMDDHAKLRWDIRGRMLGEKFDYCY